MYMNVADNVSGGQKHTSPNFLFWIINPVYSIRLELSLKVVLVFNVVSTKLEIKLRA